MAASQESDGPLKSVVSFGHGAIHLKKTPTTRNGQQFNQICNNTYSNKKSKRTEQYREE